MRYLAAVALLCLGFSAQAQVTFGASVTNANGSLTTALTWDAPGASGCVASGHPAWDGDKTASGTLELPEITMSGTYSLTLSCTFPGDRTARLSWQRPTTNMDGSALTNLDGYTIHYGRSPDVLSGSVSVPLSSTLSHTLTDLELGTWYFAVRAYNTQGVASALSNVVSKTLTEGTSEAQSVSLTVNPVPSSTVVAVE